MCTAIYPGLSARFAFAIGGEDKPGAIGKDQLDAMESDLGFNPRYVAAVARSLVGALPDALAQVKTRLWDEARSGTERTLLERLARWITTNTRKHAKRWGLHT